MANLSALNAPVIEALKVLSWLVDDLLPLRNYNITYTRLNPEAKIVLTTRPTPLQEKAFRLLAINPACTQ